MLYTLYFKGELHPKPNLNMFCVLSQIYQNYFEKVYNYLVENNWETQKWH